MQIDFMRLPADEAERLCYAEGFENAAKLFARIEALQYALEQATATLETIEIDKLTPKQAAEAAREMLAIIKYTT